MKISNRVRSAVCVLLYISYTAIYMARLNLSMSSDALTGAGILTDVEYGILGGAFLVVYALGRLFNGWLSDRLPPRTMICAGLLLSGAANIVFSALPPFSGMLVLWSLNAFAQSMLWSPILRVVAAMYDGERAGKITSLMVTSVAAGNIVGIVVNTALIVRCGIRFAFIIPGGINVLLGAAVLILLGRTGIGTTETDKSAQPVSQAPLVSLLRRPDMLAVVAYAFAHGIMKDNITVWMTKYFIAAYDIDLTKASYFVIFIPAVGFVGRMLYPLVYRLTGQKEHIASLFGFVICPRVFRTAVLRSGVAGRGYGLPRACLRGGVGHKHLSAVDIPDTLRPAGEGRDGQRNDGFLDISRGGDLVLCLRLSRLFRRISADVRLVGCRFGAVGTVNSAVSRPAEET